MYTRQEIQNILSNGDQFARMDLAQDLVEYPVELAEPILLGLLDDEVDLVRVNACDSLCISRSLSVWDRLMQMAKMDVFLVRGYAILSATEITVQTNEGITTMKDFLTQRLRQEKSQWVKVCIYTGLYQLGEVKWIGNLFTLLNHRQYRIRCSVVNSLADIADKNNIVAIRQALAGRMQIETSEAVMSTIRSTGILLK